MKKFSMPMIGPYDGVFDDEHGDLTRMFKFAVYGKSTPKAPAAPDPEKTASAQAAANRETAIAEHELGMVDQYTPYGSLTYQQTGESAAGNPLYSALQTLSPDQQRQLDLTNQLGIGFGETAGQQLGNVRGALAKPVDYGQFGAAPQANEATRQATAEALYNRVEPLMARDRDRLETRLANQGVTMGSDAYDDAVDEMNRANTDTRLAIENQALGQMSQLYGLERGARDAAINELVQQRQIPLNEMMAMTSGSQVQAPSFVNTPRTGIQPGDLQGATYASYQGDLNNYNQRLQQNNAMMGGLFGLGGAGLMAMSDRRLKTNIVHTGHLQNGLNVYSFNYVWGGPRQSGVMADEVRQVMPGAVHDVGGFDAVDYAEVLR